jgi:hypothetical protein
VEVACFFLAFSGAETEEEGKHFFIVPSILTILSPKLIRFSHARSDT